MDNIFVQLLIVFGFLFVGSTILHHLVFRKTHTEDKEEI